MWSLDSGVRACQQHKRQVVSFMFAVNEIWEKSLRFLPGPTLPTQTIL